MAISNLLFSCSEKFENTTITHLTLSKKNGSGILNNYSFNDDLKIISIDTFKVDHCEKTSNVENQIVGGELINSCGIFNLKTKKNKLFNDKIILSVQDSLIYLYDINERYIIENHIENVHYNKKINSEKFDFQLVNNKVLFNLLCSDYKKILIINQGESGKYNLVLKYLTELKEELILENLSNNFIDTNFNITQVPAIIWLNESEFLFTNYLNNFQCEINKYNIKSKQSLKIGLIKNIKTFNSNNKFIKDLNNNVYYKIGKDYFKIDFNLNKIYKSNYDLGNNFELVSEKEFYKIKYKDDIIGEIPKNSTFEINSNYIRTSKNKIVLIYNIRNGINSQIWQNKCQIWTAEKWRWINIESNDFCEIISLN